MTGDVPGAIDPMWAHHPRTRRKRSTKALKTHLRVGAGGPFEGPACGNDLRVESRGFASSTVPLTLDPALVTCRICLRSYAFQQLTGQ